jgi:hypothetical protein
MVGLEVLLNWSFWCVFLFVSYSSKQGIVFQVQIAFGFSYCCLWVWSGYAVFTDVYCCMVSDYSLLPCLFWGVCHLLVGMSSLWFSQEGSGLFLWVNDTWTNTGAVLLNCLVQNAQDALMLHAADSWLGKALLWPVVRLESPPFACAGLWCTLAALFFGCKSCFISIEL